VAAKWRRCLVARSLVRSQPASLRCDGCLLRATSERWLVGRCVSPSRLSLSPLAFGSGSLIGYYHEWRLCDGGGCISRAISSGSMDRRRGWVFLRSECANEAQLFEPSGSRYRQSMLRMALKSQRRGPRSTTTRQYKYSPTVCLSLSFEFESISNQPPIRNVRESC
jgi:hypothetical protein